MFFMLENVLIAMTIYVFRIWHWQFSKKTWAILRVGDLRQTMPYAGRFSHRDTTMRIGIDLGGTKIEAAALDRSGSIVYRNRVPTPAGDYAATVAAVVTLVSQAESACGPAE